MTLQMHKGGNVWPVRGIDEGFVCFTVDAVETFY